MLKYIAEKAAREAHMNKSVKALTASSYIAMFFLGVGITIIGAAARNIGLSPYQLGLLISIQQLGFAISVVVAGALADVVEKPKILFVGSFILGIAFLTFYTTQLFWLNLIIMLFIGIGIGSYEGTTDAMLLDLHQENQSRYININHFFVTIGSVLITLYLIFLQLNWRSSVIQSGVIVLLLSAFFLFTRTGKRKTGAGSFLKKIGDIKNKKAIAILFIASVFAVGLELGTLGFLTSFLVELRGFSHAGSKIGVVVFLLGIASGRVVIGLVAKTHLVVRYILVLFGASVLFFVGLYFVDLGSFSYLSVFLAGSTLSALFPLIITLAGLLFKDAAGTVIGLLKLTIPFGGMLIPFVISLISKGSSLQVSMLIFPVTAVMGFCLILFSRNRLSLHEG